MQSGFLLINAMNEGRFNETNLRAGTSKCIGMQEKMYEHVMYERIGENEF